jgi:hypothetical protein
MKPRILQLSQRRLSDLVANCQGYEFEDTLAAVTNSERIDATDQPAIDFSRRVYKFSRIACGSPNLARRLAPRPRSKVTLHGDFDLFFPAFNNVYELYALSLIPHWRERSKKAACFITEAWSDMLPEYLLELLASLDHVFIGNSHCVEAVERMTGRPCSYLPLGVDVVRFAPHAPDLARPITIAYIGRRSQVTHRALLDEAEGGHFFYYYDTVAASGGDLQNRTFHVDNPMEHRRLLASILKRSRFFVANRSFANSPQFTAGREEISSRFYEGIASGTFVLGEAPRTDVFKTQFDWPDAVFPLPFDSPDVGRTLARLHDNRDRLQVACRNNVREAALRHDWLHRIQVVFDTLGLPHTEEMEVRAQLLNRIALSAST